VGGGKVVKRFFIFLQELNNRLAAEITKMRAMASEDGDSGITIQGKELYELEVRRAPHNRPFTWQRETPSVLRMTPLRQIHSSLSSLTS